MSKIEPSTSDTYAKNKTNR